MTECYMRCDKEAEYMAFYGDRIEFKETSEAAFSRKPVCAEHRQYEKMHAQEDVVMRKLENVEGGS